MRSKFCFRLRRWSPLGCLCKATDKGRSFDSCVSGPVWKTRSDCPILFVLADTCRASMANPVLNSCTRIRQRVKIVCPTMLRDLLDELTHISGFEAVLRIRVNKPVTSRRGNIGIDEFQHVSPCNSTTPRSSSTNPDCHPGRIRERIRRIPENPLFCRSFHLRDAHSF